MTEEQRYNGVQADITRLLDQAANDNTSGGMVGLGAVWLAAELYMRNEQAHQSEIATKEVNHADENEATRN